MRREQIVQNALTLGIAALWGLFSPDLTHRRWSGTLKKLGQLRHYDVQHEEKSPERHRADLRITSPDGETYFVEANRNVLTADLVRFKRALEDSQIENARGIILSVSDTPEKIHLLASEYNIEILHTPEELEGLVTIYQCPVCPSRAGTPTNLARHMIVAADPEHIQWIESQGSKPAGILHLDDKELGKADYRPLAGALQRQAKVKADLTNSEVSQSPREDA